MPRTALGGLVTGLVLVIVAVLLWPAGAGSSPAPLPAPLTVPVAAPRPGGRGGLSARRTRPAGSGPDWHQWRPPP